MKIIIIEATSEDLRANRTVADALTDAIIRVGEIIGMPRRVFTDFANEDEAEEETEEES